MAEKTLAELAQEAGISDLTSRELAVALDAMTDLSLPHLRQEFELPLRSSLTPAAGKRDASTMTDTAEVEEEEERVIYMCGNSLGLQPKRTRALVNEELDIWSRQGVTGHFSHPLSRPWKDITDSVVPGVARLVGAAHDTEVAVMGTLTANLHALMSSFYRPQGRRTKICIEEKAFPSDEYAMQSQCRLHGLDPAQHLLHIAPRPGEAALRTDDILSFLETHGAEIAVLSLAGVQYYTGQLFDIPTITAAAHTHGIVVGWDLAHAVGNVPLTLHDWGVDFATWCHYKYVNAGPGAIAGIFVHANAHYPQQPQPPSTSVRDGGHEARLQGWWGHDALTRFQMPPTFQPSPGAWGYQLSNPSVLDVVALLGSLQIFANTDMATLRRKSVVLTTLLLEILTKSKAYRPIAGSDRDLSPTTTTTTAGATNTDASSSGTSISSCGGTDVWYTILTPHSHTSLSSSLERGAQISLQFSPPSAMPRVMAALVDAGIVADEREPGVIRIAPIALYSTFTETWTVGWRVRDIVETMTMAGTEKDETDSGTTSLLETL